MGCIRCKYCDNVRSNFFCSKHHNQKISDSALFSKLGYCSDFKERVKIGSLKKKKENPAKTVAMPPPIPMKNKKKYKNN